VDKPPVAQSGTSIARTALAPRNGFKPDWRILIPKQALTVERPSV
jgi:hypothetical protein